MPNLNVRPESGSDIYRLAGNARINGKNNTADAIVNTQGTLQLKDLEGAMQAAQSPTPNTAYKDAIFLQGTNAEGQAEFFKVDLQDPTNRATLDQMISDLKNGQSVKLDAKNLNVISQNRPTTLPFAFSTERLESLSRSPSEALKNAAKGIQSTLRDFEYTNLKDGQQLTDAQKLNLAVNSLERQGVDAQTQKQLIGELFYASEGNAAERIHQIQRDDAGNVTVSFQHIADSGDTLAIAPQSFPAVQAYQGTDDHGHQTTVDHIHQGVYNSRTLSNGKILQEPFEGPGTHLRAQRSTFERDFLASDKARPFQAMNASQRQNSPDYQIALADYKIAAQRKYVEWGASQAMDALSSQVQSYRNGTLSANDLADQALPIIMNLRNSSLNMQPHTTPTLEDEAAVAAFMDQVEKLRTGNPKAEVRTNYDNDSGQFNVGPGSERPALRPYHLR